MLVIASDSCGLSTVFHLLIISEEFQSRENFYGTGSREKLYTLIWCIAKCFFIRRRLVDLFE